MSNRFWECAKRSLTAVAKQDPSYQPTLKKIYQDGHALLMEHAQEIKNEPLRSQFLENVPYNQAFLSLR